MESIIFVVVALLSLLLQQNITDAQDTEIVEGPVTVRTLLNDTAYFQCICRNCQSQSWEVNNVNANFDENEGKGIKTSMPVTQENGDKLYSLTIPATEELNNSNITCTIYKNPVKLISDYAYLQIQGKLASVSDLKTAQFNITTLELTYSAPFSLENVSIIYYIIEIRDEDTSDVIIINTTSVTSFINISEYCNKHIIYITPWNGLGGGKTSIVSDVVFYNNPQIATPVLLFTYYNRTTFLFYIQFEVNTSCVGAIPQTVTITADCKNTGCETVHLGPCVLHLLDHNKTSSGNCSITTNSTSNTQVIIDLSDHLLSGHYYELDVIVITLEIQGISPLVKSFYISTFHTVKAEITSATLTSVCIKCTLKTGSTSQGCVIIFQDTSGKNGNISRQIDRTPGEVIAYKCIEDLPDGIYKVSITDSEIYQENDDGSIAFEMNSNVIIMRPTVSTDAVENIEDETSISRNPSTSQQYTYVEYASTLSASTSLISITRDIESYTVLSVTLFCVTAVIIGLMALIIIALVIHLKKQKKKVRRYRTREQEISRQHRNLETLFSTVTSPDGTQTLEPVYENSREIPDKSTVVMTHCPAYETVPVKPKHSTLTSPL